MGEHMTKQTVTNLLAGAIIAVGGMALARPAQAAEAVFDCQDSHAAAVEGARSYCGSLGYSLTTVTTYCTNNTATSSSVSCHN
jgi:hypothetical protein